MIIIKNILYFVQIRHTDDFPSTGTWLVNDNQRATHFAPDSVLRTSICQFTPHITHCTYACDHMT